MTVPTHFRIVFRGVWKNTPETWSFGLHFKRNEPAGPDATLGDVDVAAMKNDCKNFFLAGASKIPSSAQLTDVRGYQIGTDGKMQGSPELVDCSDENIVGVSGSVYPPQIALVMTHVGAERGPGRFGRVFLPTSAPLDTDLRISAIQAGMIRDEYVNFIKNCSDRVDLTGIFTSSNLENISAVAGGAKQAVHHVECGRVLDTLRSRRRGLVEERAVGGAIDW